MFLWTAGDLQGLFISLMYQKNKRQPDEYVIFEKEIKEQRQLKKNMLVYYRDFILA